MECQYQSLILDRVLLLLTFCERGKLRAIAVFANDIVTEYLCMYSL